MGKPPTFAAEGMKEAQKALKAAGGTPDDQRRLNRQIVDMLIVPRAKVEVPVRSGHLKGTIRSDATPALGIVLVGRAGTVNYAGPIHFGWSTRGLGNLGTRKQVLAAFERDLGANWGQTTLTRRAILKTTRRTKQTKGPLNERNAQGRYTAGTHRSTQVVRNRLRGGPIKPNPFVYEAIDARQEAVHDEFVRQLEQRFRIEQLL